jgi:hypothetical protein
MVDARSNPFAPAIAKPPQGGFCVGGARDEKPALSDRSEAEGVEGNPFAPAI